MKFPCPFPLSPATLAFACWCAASLSLSVSPLFVSSQSSVASSVSNSCSSWSEGIPTPTQFNSVAVYPSYSPTSSVAFLFATFISSDTAQTLPSPSPSPSPSNSPSGSSSSSFSSPSSSFPGSSATIFSACTGLPTNELGYLSSQMSSDPSAGELLDGVIDTQGNVVLLSTVAMPISSQASTMLTFFESVIGAAPSLPVWSKALDSSYSTFAIAFGSDDEVLFFGVPITSGADPSTPVLMMFSSETGAMLWQDVAFGTDECLADNQHLALYVPPMSQAGSSSSSNNGASEESVYVYAQCGSSIFAVSFQGLNLYTLSPPSSYARPIPWYSAPRLHSISTRYVFVLQSPAGDSLSGATVMRVYERNGGAWLSTVQGNETGEQIRDIYALLRSQQQQSGETMTPNPFQPNGTGSQANLTAPLATVSSTGVAPNEGERMNDTMPVSHDEGGGVGPAESQGGAFGPLGNASTTAAGFATGSGSESTTGVQSSSNENKDAFIPSESQLQISVQGEAEAQLSVDTDPDLAVMVFETSGAIQVSLYMTSALVSRFSPSVSTTPSTPSPLWTTQFNVTDATYSSPYLQGSDLYFLLHPNHDVSNQTQNVGGIVFVINVLNGAITRGLSMRHELEASSTSQQAETGGCVLLNSDVPTTKSASTSGLSSITGTSGGSGITGSSTGSNLDSDGLDLMLYLVCDGVELVGISGQDPQWQQNRADPIPISTVTSSGVDNQMLFTSVALDPTGLIVDSNGNIIVDTTNSFVAAPPMVPGSSVGSSSSTGVNHSNVYPLPPPVEVTPVHSNDDSGGGNDGVGWGLALALVLIIFCTVIGCFIYSCFGLPGRSPNGRSDGILVAPEQQGAIFAPAALDGPAHDPQVDQNTGPQVTTRGLGSAEQQADKKRLVAEERGSAPLGAESQRVVRGVRREERRPSTVGLTSNEGGMVEVELEDTNAGNESRRSSISQAPYDFKRFHDAV